MAAARQFEGSIVRKFWGFFRYTFTDVYSISTFRLN